MPPRGKEGTSNRNVVQAKMEADTTEHKLLSVGARGFHGTILAKSGGKITKSIRGVAFSWLLGRSVTLQALFPAGWVLALAEARRRIYRGFRRSGLIPSRKVPMSRARSVGDELASRQVGADGTPFSSEGA